MFIQEAELFKGIASHIIDEVAEIISEDTFPSGHVIVEKGDFTDCLYMLEEGEINITIQGRKRISFQVNSRGKYLVGLPLLSLISTRRLLKV